MNLWDVNSPFFKNGDEKAKRMMILMGKCAMKLPQLNIEFRGSLLKTF